MLMNIKEVIRDLTKEELEDLIKFAKSQKQLAPTNRERIRYKASYTPAGGDPYDYVLKVACEVCKELGRDLREVTIAKRNSAYPTFKEAVPAVVEHIKQFAPNRTYETAIFRLAYRHMAIEHDFGLALMLAQTSQVPAMLDEMFPGYYQAGLMSLVIGRLKG
jgi:hypothetical protein